MVVLEHTNYRGKGLIIMTAIHGGDIYRNRVEIDFSVNVNPLGIPETVKKAMHKAVEVCGHYLSFGAVYGDCSRRKAGKDRDTGSFFLWI